MSRCSVWGALVLAYLALAGLPLSAFAAPAQAGGTQPPCRLSEIRRLPPDSAQPVWVELSNETGEPCDIRRWCVRDGNGTLFVLPADLEPVPARGTVLVISGSPASEPRLAIASGAQRSTRVYAGDEIRMFGRGEANECALYSAPTPSPESIVDFVYWGRLSHTQQADWAVQAGLCSRDVDALQGPLFVGPTWGEVPQAPDSLGRPPNVSDLMSARSGTERLEQPCIQWPYWVAYPEADVTPGAPNPLPAPVVLGDEHRLRDRGAYDQTTFCWGQPQAVCLPCAPSHLQVARDPTFRTLLTDIIVGAGRDGYVLEPGLPAGTYFWRVRTEGPGGLVSRWSGPAKLVQHVSREPLP